MKLYVLTRRDLPVSYQAVQSGHAVAQYLKDNPNTPWENGTLVYLGVPDLPSLEKWMWKLDTKGVSYSTFIEPDIGNQPTSFATLDNGHLFKKLRLL